MQAIAQGKQLGNGDLSLVIRDESGIPFTPYSISYSIFSYDPSTSTQTLASQPNVTPDTTGVGQYWVNMTLPTLWVGVYRVVWYITRTPSDPQTTLYEDFQIVPFNPISNTSDAMSVYLALRPSLSPKIAEYVMNVRVLLSDTNPDRNYHFRPPTAAKTVAGYTSRVGFIWDDATIIRMLKLSINQLDSYNPLCMYDYTLDTAPEAWAEAACLGAASKCLSAEGARWIADEFDYSLNGVQLTLNKSQNYMSLANAYSQEFLAWAPQITAVRPGSVGLRQNRWIL